MKCKEKWKLNLNKDYHNSGEQKNKSGARSDLRESKKSYTQRKNQDTWKYSVERYKLGKNVE